MKKNYLFLILAVVISLTFSVSSYAKVVGTTLGREFTKIFPDLSDNYIDLNGNGKIDRLEDMDEKIPDSRVKDNLIQVQEILDFIQLNFRFIDMDKLKAVKDVLLNASGEIPELISLNYSSLIDGIISEKERLGANDLYLTPSALKAAREKMTGFIATMLNAYRKEEQQYEKAFSDANRELFRMIEAGYPLPELNSDDKELLTNLTINTIIKEKENDTKKVLTAIRTLGRLQAKSSIPYLKDLLSLSDYSIETAIALGNIGGNESRQILVDKLESEEPGKLKNTLIMALGKTGSDDSVKLILSLLEGEENEPETEKTIVSALSSLSIGGVRDRKIYSILTDYLKSDDPEIRILAISGIAAYKSAAASALLLPILKTEKSEQVQVALVKSLSNDNNPGTVPAFSNLLQGAETSDELKIELIKGIGKNENGIKAVASVVTYLGSTNEDVRVSASDSLENLYRQNGPVVIGGISRTINQSNDKLFLTEASSLLARLADPVSIVTVLNLLGSPFPEVKKNATWTLYRMSPPDNIKVVAELQKLVTSETEPVEVRINAVRALGSIGYDTDRIEVWKTLLTTLKLKDPKYRMLKFYGIEALGSMGRVNPEITGSLTTIVSRESDASLKLAAVNSLRDLSPGDSAIAKVLAGSFNKSDDDLYRTSVLEALGDMGSETVSDLAPVLLEKEKSPLIKNRVIYVLSHIGDEKSLSALLDIADDTEVSDFLIGTLEEADRETLTALIQRRLKTETDPDKMGVYEDLISRFETY